MRLQGSSHAMLIPSSYATIDWIHDQIKESSRVRRLRTAAKRSRGGAVRNAWDRFQGWFVVTIVGESSMPLAPLLHLNKLRDRHRHGNSRLSGHTHGNGAF